MMSLILILICILLVGIKCQDQGKKWLILQTSLPPSLSSFHSPPFTHSSFPLSFVHSHSLLSPSLSFLSSFHSHSLSLLPSFLLSSCKYTNTTSSTHDAGRLKNIKLLYRTREMVFRNTREWTNFIRPKYNDNSDKWI